MDPLIDLELETILLPLLAERWNCRHMPRSQHHAVVSSILSQGLGWCRDSVLTSSASLQTSLRMIPSQNISTTAMHRIPGEGGSQDQPRAGSLKSCTVL